MAGITVSQINGISDTRNYNVNLITLRNGWAQGANITGGAPGRLLGERAFTPQTVVVAWSEKVQNLGHL